MREAEGIRLGEENSVGIRYFGEDTALSK